MSHSLPPCLIHPPPPDIPWKPHWFGFFAISCDHCSDLLMHFETLVLIPQTRPPSGYQSYLWSILRGSLLVLMLSLSWLPEPLATYRIQPTPLCLGSWQPLPDFSNLPGFFGYQWDTRSLGFFMPLLQTLWVCLCIFALHIGHNRGAGDRGFCANICGNDFLLFLTSWETTLKERERCILVHNSETPIHRLLALSLQAWIKAET